MTIDNLKTMLVPVFKDAGLLKCPRCYQDFRFISAVVAGPVVLWFIHGWVPVFSSGLVVTWYLLISILIWQPLIEELLFRGIIQGQFAKYKWGQPVILKFTVANIATSVLFAGMHMLHSSPMWSLMIFLPSLLYGYFRDEFKSVYPSMVLHSSYNFMVIIGLILNGNVDMSSLVR